MNDEQILFQRYDITVTPSRLMVGSKTYAIRNIVSTKGLEICPGWLGRLMGGQPEYSVILATAAGEISAYSTPDSELVSDLLAALDNAIAGM